MSKYVHFRQIFPFSEKLGRYPGPGRDNLWTEGGVWGLFLDPPLYMYHLLTIYKIFLKRLQ